MGTHTEHFKLVAMTIIIAILSSLFIGLLVDAFYEAPKYEDFCKSRGKSEPYPLGAPAKENCNITRNDEENECFDNGGNPIYDYKSGCPAYQECDFCHKLFEEANNKYNRNIFFIVAPLGLIMIIYGVYFGVGFIGSGFMFGGIMSVAYGTIRYFSGMSKFMRVLVIFIELVIVVWLGMKKFKK